jgi:hypothetical protein
MSFFFSFLPLFPPFLPLSLSFSLSLFLVLFLVFSLSLSLSLSPSVQVVGESSGVVLDGMTSINASISITVHYPEQIYVRTPPNRQQQPRTFGRVLLAHELLESPNDAQIMGTLILSFSLSHTLSHFRSHSPSHYHSHSPSPSHFRSRCLPFSLPSCPFQSTQTRQINHCPHSRPTHPPPDISPRNNTRRPSR